MVWAILAVGLVLVSFVWVYNRLVRLHQNVRESWSAIDTELKRRYDLIPNLVQAVGGYAGHERQTLDAVVTARAAAVAARGSFQEQVAGEQALTRALHGLLAVAEAYPQLKADEGFLGLQHELERTETRISQARRFFNANIREFNTAVRSFPTSLFAGLFGYRPQEYFELDDPAQRAAPGVTFETNP